MPLRCFPRASALFRIGSGGAGNIPGSIWWVGLGCNGLWSRAPETQLMA